MGAALVYAVIKGGVRTAERRRGGHEHSPAAPVAPDAAMVAYQPSPWDHRCQGDQDGNSDSGFDPINMPGLPFAATQDVGSTGAGAGKVMGLVDDDMGGSGACGSLTSNGQPTIVVDLGPA